MGASWLVVGKPTNWKYAFENGNIWGLKDYREMAAMWNMLSEGDQVLFYATSPHSGIIGLGRVTTKFRQTKPLWPDEQKKQKVIWPLRFEFDVEYCLPNNAWGERRFGPPDVVAITGARASFYCVPDRVGVAARQHWGIAPAVTPDRTPDSLERTAASGQARPDHDTAKNLLVDIGRVQGFIAEAEYPIDGSRLDAVWRRVAGSVPTYAFEVQVGGDIYHAVAKLKHAYDLWNSHIFLVADPAHRVKLDELLAGTFHEVKTRLGFLHLEDVAELHKRKMSYREMERAMGIIQ